MKKTILKLGKVLKKAEQTQIQGGSQRRHYDPICDGLNETQHMPGCPCWTDTNCSNMPTFYIDEFGIKTHVLRSGTCQSGTCVV
ncbi:MULTISPECIES: hypothetical protein [unclassified Tenacibaculum]|uniref:hypothetical protein n=1 Tax=unclassified Tenacibaculum TaxID=2635139 RepID=UPI001F46D553|nr:MULTISPECIES: hypothetical protein [unclassified Tenacibaculum]MCF2876336.1 hypothetical protein [Tenacibaculum sp. Cn5-1]MCF2936799.1 hypothetical protein [Tenacibaculum sp. Cn5-34]MCG7511754.1 hypothetical protein [Tenacibaculum sp. Cn5-46]